MQTIAKEKILDSLSNLFRLPPAMSVTEWCEANLELTSIQTDTPGRFSTRLTPYVRDVLDDFKNPEIEVETLCFGAQTAKTMSLMAGISWALVNTPRPAMWVMPNKDLARAFSETRLQPLFESCAELMEAKHPDRNRWKKTQMEFDGSVFTLIGSNSAANLASRPVGLLAMDETDKFKEATDKEANAIELAELRTRTFASPKIFKTSTPSTAEAPIWQSFLAGTMHRFFLHCPHCEKELLLTFNPERSVLPRVGCEAALRWDSKAKGPEGWVYRLVEASAHYICPSCSGRIEERHKTRMLRGGKWKATNPNADPSQVSRHLPTFYAPWKKASWGKLAVEFLKAKISIDGLKGYINGVLAEPDMLQFEGGIGERNELIVLDAEPLAKTVRILQADKQLDHLWYVCREFVEGGHSRLVEWGKVDTEDDLEEVRARLEVAPDLTGEDSGYDPQEVYRNCARFGWFAVRGDPRESWTHHEKDKKGKTISVEKPYITRMFDPYIGTKQQGKSKIAELKWSNPTIKDILFRLRDSRKSKIRWEVPEAYSTDEYWRHLDGEYKAREFNRRTGQISYLYKKRSRHWPNHLLDCEAEILVVAIKIGILKTSPPKEE